MIDGVKIVHGVRFLYIDTIDTLVEISINKWQLRSGRMMFSLRNLATAAIFLFYENCPHKHLKERDPETLKFTYHL